MPISHETPHEPTPTVPAVEDPLPVARPVERDFDFVDEDEDERPRRRRPRREPRVVRIFLAVMGIGFLAVLGIAAWLQPYDEGGQARTHATHTQLGLEPCSMIVLTGKPCPACGMTTSFALLVHGDVGNSVKANWVGTLMCASILLLAPWTLVSAWRGRLLWVRNGELFSTIVLSALLLLMMARWLFIMLT